jgi:hypothetical protein
VVVNLASRLQTEDMPPVDLSAPPRRYARAEFASRLLAREAAILAEAKVRIGVCIDAFMGIQFGKLPSEDADNFLVSVRDAVQDKSSVVGERYGAIRDLVLGYPSETSATWIQTAGWFFQWLHSVPRTPQPAGRPVILPGRLPGGSRDGVHTELLTDVADLPYGCEYGKMYLEKMTLWGQYLTAQLLETDGLDHEAMKLMQDEIPTLQQQYAFAIPTRRALSAIAEHGPLLEVGAGTGYWASLLAEMGVDIIAYNSSTWTPRFNWDKTAKEAIMSDSQYLQMKVAGPEAALSAKGRALVLMWPDWGGAGIFALEALEMFDGKTLICVGEWEGHTLGTFHPALKPTGQSFSAEFQKQVQKEFDLLEKIYLPSWPLNGDVVQIFRRKK